MLYSSTRGEGEPICSAHAIANGLAADGGLYMPNEIPKISLTEICALQKLSYPVRAVAVLSRFLTDYTEEELQAMTETAYHQDKFGGSPVPLKPVAAGSDVLELWHGPTSAFKDMALQLLPHLLTSVVAKTGINRKKVILVATSGDTGKAALDGFADVAGTEIIVFYPEEGVSPIQKLQMVTQKGNNVHVVAVKGNFDDAQSGVKKIFSNTDLAAELDGVGLDLSSANSINWGRLVPQIVYYFSAYADAINAGRVKAGEAVNFSVPTGNFGDILAGYFAKLMGLPVHKFICASNSNNVLTDFFKNGVYDKNREFYKTIAPSMDILISSNLERLLYLATGRDAAKVKGWMQELQDKGSYDIGSKLKKVIGQDFFGVWVDEIETKETIEEVYEEHKYLMDTHTAIAWRAMEKYRVRSSDDTHCIVLSTASPYKFPKPVLEAVGGTVSNDAFAMLAAIEEKTKMPIPPAMLELQGAAIEHDIVVEKDEMEQVVRQILLS